MSARLSTTLRIFVPVPIRHGWAWRAWPVYDPAGTEQLNDMSDLPRVLRVYGRTAAQIIRFRETDRFNVTAFGTRSNKAYGRDQWIWDEEFRVFRPQGDPLVPLVKRVRLLAIHPGPVEFDPASQPERYHPFPDIHHVA